MRNFIDGFFAPFLSKKMHLTFFCLYILLAILFLIGTVIAGVELLAPPSSGNIFIKDAEANNLIAVLSFLMYTALFTFGAVKLGGLFQVDTHKRDGDSLIEINNGVINKEHLRSLPFTIVLIAILVLFFFMWFGEGEFSGNPKILNLFGLYLLFIVKRVSYLFEESPTT